jgi:hypothetical protein
MYSHPILYVLYRRKYVKTEFYFLNCKLNIIKQNNMNAYFCQPASQKCNKTTIKKCIMPFSGMDSCMQSSNMYCYHLLFLFITATKFSTFCCLLITYTMTEGHATSSCTICNHVVTTTHTYNHMHTCMCAHQT